MWFFVNLVSLSSDECDHREKWRQDGTSSSTSDASEQQSTSSCCCCCFCFCCCCYYFVYCLSASVTSHRAGGFSQEAVEWGEILVFITIRTKAWSQGGPPAFNSWICQSWCFETGKSGRYNHLNLLYGYNEPFNFMHRTFSVEEADCVCYLFIFVFISDEKYSQLGRCEQVICCLCQILIICIVKFLHSNLTICSKRRKKLKKKNFQLYCFHIC